MIGETQYVIERHSLGEVGEMTSKGTSAIVDTVEFKSIEFAELFCKSLFSHTQYK